MNLQKFAIVFFGVLLLASLSFNTLVHRNHFEQACKNAEESISRFQTEVNTFTTNHILLDKIISQELNLDEIKSLNAQAKFIYIFQDDKLLFWNKNATIPEVPINSISEHGTMLVQKNGNYFAIKKDYGIYKIVAMQLIKYKYPIANKYLSNQFSDPYTFDQYDEIKDQDADEGRAIHNQQGEVVFKITQNNAPSKQAKSLPLLLSYMSIISFWFLVYYLLVLIKKKYGVKHAFVSLLLLSMSFITLLHRFNFEFKKTILFSPELHASQFYGNSLGHLLIYSSLAFIISGFIAYFFYYRRWTFGKLQFILYSGFVFLMFLLSNLIIKSLILDSVISFELNNFTQITIYTLFGLFILAFILSSFITFLYLWIYNAHHLFGSKSYTLVLGFALSASLAMYFIEFGFIALLSPALFTVLASLYVFLLLNPIFSTRLNYILLSLFLSSIISASLLSYYNLIKEDVKKSSIANQLSKKRDLITEYRFELIQQDIKLDPFFKKFFISPFISQKDVQQRLSYIYFNGYLSKYNVNAIAFNLEGKAIKTADDIELSSYYNLINKKAEDTFSEWLFLVPKENGKNNYVSILPIENNGSVSGTLVIELSLKTYHKENLYPELLIEQQSNPISDYNSKKEYEYGIYKNKYLIAQTGEYPFPYFFGVFDTKENFPFEKNSKNFRLNFFEIDEDTIVVMSSEKLSALIPISLFSYIFCFYGILLVFIYLFLQIINYKFGEHNVFTISFTFRNRISIAIISIAVASFVVVGIVTIGYFTRLYKVNNTENLIKKQKLVLSSLEYYIEKQVRKEPDGLPVNLGTEIASLAEIQGIDINIFSLEGNLLQSSQPGVFGNGLVSKKINPIAKYYLTELKSERYILNEVIGKLIYQSVYVPIRAKNGAAIAFLNLPYFAQKATLRTELSNLMVALVNVYVLLLLISIILAFIISSSITSPLANISRKISLVNLDGKNEPIIWESNDEIGTLVKEYNKMILQIEESASIMAQSERESAWREMARQIAHEIKNPLTPMKLGIQHLQRALKERPEDANELAARVSKTLIEQIENLSEIATAFSSFAKMPTANKEVINLIEVLQNVVSLFRQNKESILFFHKPFDEALIYADKNQLLSVFNNLVKNALQATEAQNNAQVNIIVKQEAYKFTVSIADNGTGIPEDKKSKVFVPNFTTKSSGTGLGLAISKQIVENSQGAIWFESEENKGTTFYVTLPQYLEK